MIALNHARWAAVAVALFTGAAPAAAQVASPSAAALGLGDNYTAMARGYSTVSWNPAGLAMQGNPAFSLTLLPVRGITGLGPVSLADLKEYENELVPDAVKRRWLTSIANDGGQSGTGGSDITWIGVQAGRFALQLSSSVRATSDVSPGLAELILFGNADEEGTPKDITLAGSTVDMHAYSTGALSYAMPFTLDDASRVAVGITARYTIGHVFASGQPSSGQTTSDPIGVDFSFPLVHTSFGDDDDEDFELNNGSGFGVDLGVGYEMGVWTFAAVARNLIDTFEWDESRLRYRPSTVIFNDNDLDTDFDTRPFSAAPAAAQTATRDMNFKPSFAAGATMRYSPELTIAADARFGSGDGMATRPPTQVGAGVEYMLRDWLPLRAGGAFVKLGDDNSGFQAGAGLGVSISRFSLSASIARRSTDLGTDTFGMLNLISVGM